MESPAGDCIIEKYIDKANEIQITYFFINGTPYLIRTTDSFRGNKEMANVITYSISPSQYTSEYLEIAHNNIMEMLKGIGIINGPVMLQGFYADGCFKIFDQGLRFPGSDYERIYKKECDVDILKIVLEFSLNGKMPQVNLNSDNVFLNRKQALIIFPVLSDGNIQKIEGMEEVTKDKRVVSVWMRHREGDHIDWSSDINHRLCEIDILAEKEEVADVMSRISSTIQVFDISGESMVLDYFEK